MAAADPASDSTTIETWQDVFREFHELWGLARALPGYDKRRWARLFECLETQAFLAGYRPATARTSGPSDTSHVRDEQDLPGQPSIKSRRI
jgi:hypothetical protein